MDKFKAQFIARQALQGAVDNNVSQILMSLCHDLKLEVHFEIISYIFIPYSRHFHRQPQSCLF